VRNDVSKIDTVLSGNTSTPVNQTITQRHTRMSYIGGKGMFEDVAVTADTTSIVLQTHAAELTAEDKGVSNNTSSNTGDSSYYRHNNNDDQQKVAVLHGVLTTAIIRRLVFSR
jgi:hypothetical protein